MMNEFIETRMKGVRMKKKYFVAALGLCMTAVAMPTMRVNAQCQTTMIPYSSNYVASSDNACFYKQFVGEMQFEDVVGDLPIEEACKQELLKQIQACTPSDAPNCESIVNDSASDRQSMTPATQDRTNCGENESNSQACDSEGTSNASQTEVQKPSISVTQANTQKPSISVTQANTQKPSQTVTTAQATPSQSETDAPTGDDNSVVSDRGQEVPDGSNYDSLSYAEQVVVLVNQERAAYGLQALRLSASVTDAAMIRAKEIQSVFSHTRPNGSSFGTALKESQVSYRGAGENIAYGQPSAKAVVDAWMNSEGHRANILNADFTTIGVGHLQNGGTNYWVQLFTY
jgi:uncharacterized protein YkwD